MAADISHGRAIAIAQPTFLPWVGWFDLADQVDLLVILDDVSFSKQSWQQRNRIRTTKGLEFMTVPVKTSGRMGQLISECELTVQPFADKLVKSLRINYAKAPFFAESIEGFETALHAGVASGRLVELNCSLINWMASRLGVTTPMVRASTLGIEGHRGEHVAAICEHLGADRYISPAGSEGYLLEDRLAFDQRGVSVVLQVYEHPQYAQCFKPFESHASAVDLIFNTGPMAPQLMRSGRRPPRGLGMAPSMHSQELFRENSES